MSSEASEKGTSPVILLFAWIAVGIPLLVGVLQTVTKASALFK